MTKHLRLLLKHEAAGGFLLLLMAIIALICSNSPIQSYYYSLIHTNIGSFTLYEFVNDALMVIFFYVVGLEIKKEFIEGDLSNPKRSSLAILGAIGGMIVPAIFYTIFNWGKDSSVGWAIPMATDIAFAVGILSLLGKIVPAPLKIFLLALAIIDDLGAIIVIAVFYTSELHLVYLLSSLIPLCSLYFLNKYKKNSVLLSLLLGCLAWYFVLRSGIHATITGVILAFLTPKESLNHWIEKLHILVTFFIVPIFAFFNAGVTITGISIADIIHHETSLGVIIGLVLGKPIGIFLACYFACYFKISQLPRGVRWPQMWGVGMIAGIGFTMSLFINHLSFNGSESESYAKIGILMASLIASVLGLIVLRLPLKAYAHSSDKTSVQV